MRSYHRQTASFLSIVSQNMPEISGDVMQYWIERPQEVASVLSQAFVREQTEPVPFLRLGEKFTLPAYEFPKPLQPAELFVDGEHNIGNVKLKLYVWSDFQNLILPGMQPITSVSEAELQSFQVVNPKGATDAQIQEEMPKKHVFERDEFLPILVGKLLLQHDGCDGILLVSGHANLFYVRANAEVFVVRVRWDAAYSLWRLFAYRRDVRQWGAGHRTFSRTAVV